MRKRSFVRVGKISFFCSCWKDFIFLFVLERFNFFFVLERFHFFVRVGKI